jgi:hypothetical protein
LQVRCHAERLEAETRKTKLELHLESNLMKRKAEVEQNIEGMNLDDRREQMNTRRNELQSIAVSLDQSTGSFQVPKP